MLVCYRRRLLCLCGYDASKDFDLCCALCQQRVHSTCLNASLHLKNGPGRDWGRASRTRLNTSTGKGATYHCPRCAQFFLSSLRPSSEHSEIQMLPKNGDCLICGEKEVREGVKVIDTETGRRESPGGSGEGKSQTSKLQISLFVT